MKDGLLAWFDTEYSSLDLESAVLLQVALIVTDGSLRRVLPVEKDIRLFVHLAEGAELSPWVRKNLPGLEEKCRSPEAVETEEVDERLAACVALARSSLKKEKGEDPVLAGNSIHADWWLARRFLPKFLQGLHYRHLDVTALKLEWKRAHRKDFDKEDAATVRRWFPEALLPASGTHDAYYDVQASIAELAFYRRHLLLGRRGQGRGGKGRSIQA